MPRTARIALPHYPHHLVQRGHNQRDVFYCARDREKYLETLIEFREALGLKVYGYCLMSNHVHLIVDPGSEPSNLGKLMKRLAGRHTRYLNLKQQRSGTIWGGRFKCSPIETDRYLLACLRYVDRNPVRAKMVASAEEFPWSSYRVHAGFAASDWIDVDPVTMELADSASRRQERYREFVARDEDELELRFIRESLQRGRVTASEAFAKWIEENTGAPLSRRSRGRPFKPLETTRAPEGARIVDK